MIFSTVPSRTVSSAKSLTEPPRRPGVVGLYWRMPMGESPYLLVVSRSLAGRHGGRPLQFSEEIDARAVLFQHHDGLLPVRQPADAKAEAALLALAVLSPHLLDDHAEQLLHRRLDLVLARPGVHLERVAAVV